MSQKNEELSLHRGVLDLLEPGTLLSRKKKEEQEMKAAVGVFLRRSLPVSNESDFVNVLFRGNVVTWHMYNINIVK